MFWTRFYELCVNNGTKPNPVGKQLGIASSTITQWKQGTLPTSENLSKIAEYFNVSTDYLLGKETESVTLSPKQQKVLDLYDSLSPEQQKSFEQLLDSVLGLKK